MQYSHTQYSPERVDHIVQLAKELGLGTSQINLQEVIDPGTWMTRDFRTAALVELAGELVPSFGYKWWSKESQDLANVRIEVVDCMHFLIAAMGAVHHQTFGTSSWSTFDVIVAENIGEALVYPGYKVNLNVLFVSFSSSQPHVALRNLLSWTLQNVPPSSDSDCIIEEVITLFAAKNNLNFLRQHKGYKQGTYIKQWKGMEDNAYIQKHGLTLYGDMLAEYESLFPGH